MGQRPTLSQVAQKAGVSIATASYTFSRPDRVRPETRELVLQTADELGYFPSTTARGLATGSTKVLGLYAFDMLLDEEHSDGGADGLIKAPDPSIFPLYVDEIQRGFQLECWKRGQSLLVSVFPEDDAVGIANLAGQVDGLAVFPGTASDRSVEKIAKHLPVVLFSRPAKTSAAYSVTIDNHFGIEQLMDHLVHTHHLTEFRFVGLGGRYDQERRYESFCSFLTRMELPVPETPIYWGPSDREASIKELTRMARSGTMPHALICDQDQVALEVMKVLQSEGISIPDDVVVTGFDGILAGQMSLPRLTTVRQPLEEMGRMAVRMLLSDTDDLEDHNVVYQPALVIRESCGC